MSTFLRAKLGLAAFVIFWFLAARGLPAAAVAIGAALAVAVAGWRLVRRAASDLDLFTAAFFTLAAVAHAVAPDATAAHMVAASFAALGLFSLAGVALGRPWTAELSRAAFAAVAETPAFIAVNSAISGLWGILFLLLGAAREWDWGAWASVAIVAFGALASILGPRLLIRIGLNRMIRAQSDYHWPAPPLGDARGPDACDVAVIGAGLGGLTTAALLADHGLKVMVFESHVLPGGFCHDWPRKAHHNGKPLIFRFDSGVHDVSGVRPGGPVTRLLERLGVARDIEWLRLDHAYRHGDRLVEPPRDWRAYVAELGRQHPESAAGIAALFEDIRTIFDSLFATGETNGGVPGAPATADALMDFPKNHPLAMRWMARPFAELVALHVSAPQARASIMALSGYVTDDPASLTCAAMVPLFGYYFFGGFYPAGGSSRLPEALVRAIAARGGEVRLKTRVARILIEDGRARGVELADGRRIVAGAVVSNADLKRTFGELVDPALLPAEFRARMAAAAPACSAFMVHLGLDILPDLRPCQHVHGDLPIGMFIPSAVDPTAAPAGYAAVELIALVPTAEAASWFPPEPSLDWKAWRRTPDYLARKAAFAERMIDAAATVIPDLRDHIVYRTEASPVTFARYEATSAGAIYGISNAGRIKGARSPIPGLYIAGAGNFGPGVEAVMISGALTAEAIAPGLLKQAPRQSEAAGAAALAPA